MKLNCHDRFNRVRSMTQTKQDNDVIDHIGMVYVENKIELSCLIRKKMTHDNDVIDRIGVIYVENETTLS